MITSNSDTFGIFGLKILKIADCSLRQSDAGAPVQPQLVFLGDASPKSGAVLVVIGIEQRELLCPVIPRVWDIDAATA